MARFLRPTPPLVLGIVILLIYWPVGGFEFLTFDDSINVYENAAVQHFSWSHLKTICSSPYRGLYIPVVYTVWGSLAWISQYLWPSAESTLQPGLFHFFNVAMHAGGVFACYLLIRRLVQNKLAAAVGALFYAVHPLQVEAVAWVTGLKDVLSTFFALAALLLAFQSIDKGGRPIWKQHRYWFAFLCYCLGMLSKPGVVMVPIMIVFLGVVLLGRSGKRMAVHFLPWTLLVLPLLYVTIGSQPAEGQLFLPSWGQRFLVAGDALTYYVGKLFWPWPLGFDYGRTPQIVLAGPGKYVTGVLPYALFLIAAWKVRRPWVWVVLGLFVLPLFPVLGFVPFNFQHISTVADRYTYLSMLGPALAVARILDRYGRWTFVAAIGLCGVLTVLSALQVRFWRNNIVFNDHAVAVNPKSWSAHNNLGAAYHRAGKTHEAMTAYKQSIALDPKRYGAYENLGNLYQEASMPEEALYYYQLAIERNPYDAKILAKIAKVYKEQGHRSEAKLYFQKAALVDPQYALAFAELGLIAKAEARPEEARRYFEKAVQLAPDFGEVYNNLGLVYEQLNRLDLAEAAFRKAISLEPERVEAYNNLGLLLFHAGDLWTAIVSLQKAVELAPTHPLPYMNLGKAYAADNKANKALEAYQQALSIDPGYAPAMAAMAKIYLTQGQTDQAQLFALKAKRLGYSDPELQHLTIDQPE